MNSIPSFLNKIKQKNATIGIVGLGYVEPPRAIRFSEYALIGSGWVVTKDVPPFSLVIGNPARVVGMVDKMGNRTNNTK